MNAFLKQSIPAAFAMLVLVAGGGNASPLPEGDLYVDAATGSDANDGRSWAAAKATIQGAIDVSSAGDLILVNDGRYEPISSANKRIEIRSVHGPEATIIDASLQWPRGVTNRCATLGSSYDYYNSTLTGFCLTNGIGDWGGGSYYGVLNNCLLSGNRASQSGGGASNGLLNNCRLLGNSSEGYSGGGGAYGATLNNCVLSGNTARYGGGSNYGTLNNCTLSGNAARFSGGGADKGILNNCIVWGNTAPNGADTYAVDAVYTCSGDSIGGVGNIRANPLFADVGNGDFRLQPGSPCIDTGWRPWTDNLGGDLDGNSRWRGAQVDMGAYESVAASYSPTIRDAATFYVDSANGNDANKGTSWATARKSIQSAVEISQDGDVIIVAPGTYTPITTMDLSIRIIARDGAETTIIDGGGLARCALLGRNEQPNLFNPNYTTTNSVLEGFLLRNGKAYEGGGAYGGTLNDCTLNANVATRGGGSYGTAMNRCTLIGNTASSGGGGSWGGTLNHCVVSGNSVTDRGGGALNGMLNNCLLYRNTAGTDGGGSDGATLNNCTVYGNTAKRYGGGSNYGTLNNCIVWGNSASSSKAVYHNPTCRYSCFDEAVPGEGNIVADPLFVDAANGDYRLQASSPCVDAGSNAYAGGVSDLAGDPRIQGNVVDMGAYELNNSSILLLDGVLYVDAATGSDANDGRSWAAAKATIQGAINVSSAGNLIYVNDGRYEPISTGNKRITIASVSGPRHTIIDGGGTNRCATLGTSAGATNTVLRGFTLRNGNAGANGAILRQYGGGVCCGTVEDCHIYGNKASAGSGKSYGGGAYASILRDCSIGGNWAYEGGGAYLQYGSVAWMVDGCFFTRNRSGGNGSAINVASGAGLPITISNCLVLDNFATYSYAIRVGTNSSSDDNVLVWNCTIVGNSGWPLNPVGIGGGCASDTIIWNNRTRADNEYNSLGTVMTNSWTTNPSFVDAIHNVFLLNRNSPCIGGGVNGGDIGTFGVAMEGGFVVGTEIDGYGLILEPGTVVEAGGSAAFTAAEMGREFLHFETNGVFATTDRVIELDDIQSDLVVKAVFSKREFFVEAANGDNVNDGLSWETARRTIASAISDSVDYDTITVANGVYGAIAPGAKMILIRSVEGAGNTMIDGGRTTRCVNCLENGSGITNAVVEGFTLQNGFSSGYGGGTIGGTLRNCFIVDCEATTYAGGAYQACLQNCVVARNKAGTYGGGLYYGWADRCTICANEAAASGGGTYYGTLRDCIVSKNSVGGSESNWYGGTFDGCCTYPNRGTNPLSGDPMLVDGWNGDARLRIGSPCIVNGVQVCGAYLGDPLEGISVSFATQGAGAVSNRNALVASGDSLTIAAIQTTRPFLYWLIESGGAVSTVSNIVHTIANITADIRATAVFALGDWYVDAGNGDDTNDGGSWESALKSLQLAVDLAVDGETIWVAPGTYGKIASRNKRIRIEGVAGPEMTFFDGGGTNRCAVLGAAGVSTATNTVVAGFTFTRGFSSDHGGAVCGGTLESCLLRDNQSTRNGGATYYTVLDRCVLSNNVASASGGASFFGTLRNCTLSGNKANTYGGGSHYGTLNNCTLSGNTATYGGGSYYGTLNNCTLSGNTATYGGGSYYGTLNNCIVWGNAAQTSNAVYRSTCRYTCLDKAVSGEGNIVADPLFVDAANGDFRLLPGSPCIDAGLNAYARGDTDLDGTPRIVGGTVDMGAYEYGTLDLPSPDKVVGFSAEDGSRVGAVRLAWNAASNAWTYAVERATDATFADAATIGVTGALAFDDTNAVPETVYWYRVSGVNDGGSGEPSDPDSGWCLAAVSVAADSLPNAMAGVAYSATLQAAGGSGGYTWTTNTPGLPDGFALAANGTLSGTTMASGTYSFRVTATDSLGNAATRQFVLTVESNPDMRTVTFSLGEHGSRTGGGELVQNVLLGHSATAPTVRADSGWILDGWDADFASIVGDLTVTAKWRPAKPAIQVRDVVVPTTAYAGGEATVSWSLFNWGNAAFTGTMSEEIRLVSISNTTAMTVAAVAFSGEVVRDGSVSRTATFALPKKDVAGPWFVEVVSAISPSVSLHEAPVTARAQGVLFISPIPLPNLVVESVAAPALLVPGETANFSFTVRNDGAAAAEGGWQDAVWLVSEETGSAVKLADIPHDASLDVGASYSATAEITIPETIAIAGAVRARVMADSGDAVVESGEDNTSLAEATSSLAARLYITASAASVLEANASVRFTVKRSGPRTAALAVSLSATPAGQLSLVESMTIPAGSVSASVTARTIDNATIEGPRTVAVTASSGGFTGANASLTITDNETPHLFLSLSGSSVREGESLSGTVTRELVTDAPLTVYLTGPSTSRCGYPSSVTIQAGEPVASFSIAVPDNETAQRNETYTLRASASGHAAATETFTVDDDDVPGFTLELYPEIISEGAGANAVYATLTRVDADQIAKDVRVRLSHTPAGNLIIPSTITIPKYTMGVRFAIGTVDNARDDDDRDVTIDGAVIIESCGCDGQPSSGDAIRAVLTVIDDDGPALLLSAEPATMKEGRDDAGVLVLSHNSVLTEDLVVNLSFDTAGEIEIPATATIPAGATSVRIPVRTLDDGVEDGSQLVSVYAEDRAGVFAPASTWVQVSDQNLPDLAVPSVVVPTGVVAMEDFAVAFTVTNSGFMGRSASIPYAVHLVRGAANATLTASTLLASGTLVGGVAVDGTLSGEVVLAAPEMPGDCRVAVVIDPDGTISELDKANNTGWSAVIGVSAAYTAEVIADADAYLPDDTIAITGVATLAGGARAGGGLRVDVYLLRDSYRKTLSATTAADGTFTITYTPSAGECGHYRIGACYPGVGSNAVQDEFDVMGMKRTSTSNVIWDYALGDSAMRTVTLKNLSAAPLTGLSPRFEGIPEDCSLTWTLPDTIPGNGSVALSMTATAIGVTDGVDYEQFRVYLETAEGPALDFALYFHSQTQKAYLRATPSSINTTMAVGSERTIEVVVYNDGKGDSGPVTVTVPDVRWLSIVGGASVANLASGESMTVTLLLSPEAADGLVLNSPLSGGRLAVNCANGTGCTVPLKFTPVSDATGGVVVDAVDNNTYTLESAPHLAGANVRVTNPYTGALVASGTTGADGLWTASALPEGRYQLTITADKHDTYADELVIEPGTTARVTAFLQYKLVTATWDVVKTEIEDEYEITLVLEYETQVPAPIVKVSMPTFFEDLVEGDSIVFSIVAENIGMIAADRVHFDPPDIPNHQFTFYENDFGLAAGEAREISVRMEHVVRGRAPLMAVSSGDKKTLSVWVMGHLIDYFCGGERSYRGYTQFKYGERVVTGPDGGGSGDNWRVVPPVIIVNPPPDRRPTTDGTQDEGSFSDTISRIVSAGCAIGKCLAAVVSCATEFLVDSSTVVSCITGVIDCGLSIKGTVQTQDRTFWDIGGSVIDCGIGIAGCIPMKEIYKKIVSVISCTRGIGSNCVLPAFNWIKEKLFSKKGGSALLASSGDNDDGSALTQRFPTFAEGVVIAQEELPALRDWHVEFFGDEAWLSCEPEEKVAFLSAMRANFPAYGNYLSAETLMPFKPAGITEELVVKFVSRWNAFLRGVVSDEDAAAGTTDALRPAFLVKCSEKVAECEEMVAKYGYSSIFELLDQEGQVVADAIEDERNAVCASITLKLSQTLAMTREAFDGTLTMFNGHATTPITALKLDISVLDEEGNECKDLFEVFANGTSGNMSGGEDILAGGLSVAANGTGSAMVRFIPERGAAPTEEKLYRFGGTVTYVDPFSGETATVKLTAVSLTVSPSPYLHLDYFVQRDVYADDPFTPDVVEASMPAELAVLVRNVGGGDANKVTIASAQPEMVQNEKGLSTAFNLKDYTLEASALNGATAHLGLNTVSLGVIGPNEGKVAQWWLNSTIEGHFIGMSATVTPVNSWNTPDTALVDPNVGIHKLVRSIVADGDALPDFLVCDESNLYGTPNEIWTAAGDVLDVYAATAADAVLPPGAEIELPLVLTPARSGWNYGHATIPGLFRYAISRIVRDDGTELPLRNAWITDRTFRDGNTPLLEERLHLVDEFASNGARTYTVHLAAKPSDVPEVVAFEGVTDGEVEYASRNAVTVVFSKPIDPATFTVADLTLTKQGVYLADLSAFVITAADDSGTRFTIGNLSALCGEHGRYVLTVQCAGIADLGGQLGSFGKGVAWTFASAAAPCVVGIEGVPSRRIQSLDSLTVVFSVAIDPATFTVDALRLNGAGLGNGVAISPLGESGTRFAVSGLAALQTADGAYTLTVDATALTSTYGTAGIGSQDASWTRDTVAPVLQSLVYEDGLGGREFVLTFSEPVNVADVALGGLALSRDGASVALPASAALSPVAADNGLATQFTLAGLSSASLPDGAYTLSFSAAGVRDEAGNAATGTASVSWAVDNTPPAQIGDLAISPDGGASDTDGVTYTTALTVTGTLPEEGLAVEIIARYGGGDTALAAFAGGTGTSHPTFSQAVILPRDGNVTLVVRLTDAAGNSSETEKGVSVDAIPFTATLSGAPEDEGVAATTATLAFSAQVRAGDVTVGRFSLTRDGEPVSLEGVSLDTSDNTTFTLSGLEALCDVDGDYVLTFDGSAVRKHSSGLQLSGDAIAMSWTYVNPDREPPTVTAVLFDGEAPHGAYTNGNLFSSVSVAFSEPVNVPDLIANGLVGRAARIDLLGSADCVTGSVSAATAMAWDAESNALSWEIDPSAVPAGGARLTVDAGLIADLAGNRLSSEGHVSANGLRAYAPGAAALAQVNSYAVPCWHDGTLYVGEKTADNKGKIRHYAANGAWSYLQSDGADIEVAAQGCQGASVAFADMDGDGAAETYVGTAGGELLKFPGGEAVASPGANRAMPFACDMDGDGRDELVVGGMDGRIRVVSLDIHTGAYSFELLADANGSPLSVPNGRAAPIVADVNHDGLADIVSGDTAGNVWAFLGTGAAWCAQPVCVFDNAAGLADRSRLGYGDVDGDGIEDLIVGRSDGSVTVMSGAETPLPAVPFAVKAAVAATAGEHGAIAPAGETAYDGGETPAYTVTPAAGYHVDDVLVDGVSVGAADAYVFAPLTKSHTIHATFAPTAYAITYTGLKGASNPNPATYTVEDAVTFAAPGEVYGWAFKGWTPAAIAAGTVGAVEVAAAWERRKFDVTVDGETTAYDYEAEATFTAPGPREADGRQVVTLGTTFTAPAVTNEFSAIVTNSFSFSWDILATNWWFETTAAQNGAIVGADAGWKPDGADFTLRATPAEHHHFVRWTGDTEGCAATDDGLSVTMDRARTIGAAFAIDTFAVSFLPGAHGSLAGETEQTVEYGGAAVAPAVTPDGGYRFTGWSGDVSAPVTGGATFTAQYAAIGYAITYADLKGAANPNPATYTVEDAITFAPLADVEGWTFKGWTPASVAPGSTGDIEVAANWERPAITLAQALDATNLDWATGGAAVWAPEWSDNTAVGPHDARCGNIGDAAESWIETRVFGPGMLSFAWRVSCENRYDYGLLEIDGVVKTRISGEVGWTVVTNNLSDGLHTIRWTYRKSRSGSGGEDALWLDAVTWQPEPVPTLAEALDATNLVWKTGGDSPWVILRGEEAADAEMCGVSGSIDDYGSSWLRTIVIGPGMVSFRWRVSCEDGYDWFDFLLDGAFVDTLTGESGWVSTSFTVPDGVHELAWEYWKDEMDEDGMAGEDRAMLDQVCFEPADTGTSVADGEYMRTDFLDFLIGHGLLPANADMTAINDVAVVDGDGDGMTAWEEFVAGTDPNNPVSVFRALIAIENGVPVITWDPDLSPDRDYVILSADSPDGEWRELPDGKVVEGGASGFFRVRVILPQEEGGSSSGESAASPAGTAEPVSLTLRWTDSDGNERTETVDYDPTRLLNSLPVPERDGFRLIGWVIDGSATAEPIALDQFGPIETATLRAVWEK